MTFVTDLLRGGCVLAVLIGSYGVFCSARWAWADRQWKRDEARAERWLRERGLWRSDEAWTAKEEAWENRMARLCGELASTALAISQLSYYDSADWESA